MVTEVSLHGVTCQLEVHLLLLTTFRVKHPFPHVRVVEIPCLSFTGTTNQKKKKRGMYTKTCQKGGQRWMQSEMLIEHTKKNIPKESAIFYVVLHFEEEH